MLRKIYFKDETNKIELLLPITPTSFEMTHGLKVETINIHTLGDVNVAGYTTLANISIEGIFPAQKYSFSFEPTVDITTNYDYVEYFKKWIANKQVLRFIVTDTNINIKVIIEEIKDGEKDGTNDIYYTLSIREYRQVQSTKMQSNKTNASRSASTQTTTSSYVVKKGDTLSTVCRKFYGDSSLYTKLAKYNGIKNPSLISIGKTLKLPSITVLKSY